jgi:phosphatidylinositol glycan class B
VAHGQRYVDAQRDTAILEICARWNKLADGIQLIVTVLNPWQWFCSTRTLSNCIETSVTIVALDLWPWQWSAGTSTDSSRRNNAGSEKDAAEGQRLLSRYPSAYQNPPKQPLTHIAHSLRQCLCLAALACILRPTNILIWATLATVAWLRTSWSQRKVLVQEVLLCGSVKLGVFLTLYNRLIFHVP